MPKLGIKQQLTLDHDSWATTHRLLETITCNIRWRWVKGHQPQGSGKHWKVEVALNNFCDKKAGAARSLRQGLELDPFFPDQICGILCKGQRVHGSHREAIMLASHGRALQDYICEKSKWTAPTFHSIDWSGFHSYIRTLSKVKHTNVVKLVHNWVNDGHQKGLFLESTEPTACPAECGRTENHQHYLACFAPPMLAQKKICKQKFDKLWTTTRTATPIARALRYLITCVINETDPLPRHQSPSPSPFDKALFKA